MWAIRLNGMYWNQGQKAWAYGPTRYATQDEACEAAQEDTGVVAGQPWELVEVEDLPAGTPPNSVAAEWFDLFGHDEAHEEPADPAFAGLDVDSECGAACVATMRAVRELLDKLDPHPAVTGPILEALNVQIGIYLRG